jgi:hypothetical protein
MKLTNPETHLLRELHVLASPIVLLVGLFSGRFVEPRIGLQLVVQSFAILFVAGFISFWILGNIRSRKLSIRVSISSSVVSATVNMFAVGSLFLAFRIWSYQWPLTLEPWDADNVTSGGGEPFFIAAMLTTLAIIIWVLGIFAIGTNPVKLLVEQEAGKS